MRSPFRAHMKDPDFIKKALQLYNEYNSHNLFYKDTLKYDQLVTADPFIISKKEFIDIQERGNHLLNWLKEQKRLLAEVFQSKSLNWLKDLLIQDSSPEIIKYEQEILKKPAKYTRIIRADLSSFPFNCHEAQLRWGGLPHIQYIPTIYKKIIPQIDIFSPGNGLSTYVQKIIADHCTKDNQVSIYMSPDKYLRGNVFTAEKELEKMLIVLVSDFNEKLFEIKRSKLIHKESGQEVPLIFRRQISLETLSKTEFGRKIIALYLDGAIHFEPDLDIINDTKLGMALAFDKRTRSFFKESTRKLFLPTSIANQSMDSFNSVFDTNYTDLEDFVNSTTRSQRKYIFKYGGMDMFKSFGGGQVYRLDDSKNHVRKFQKKMKGLWFFQKMDSTRFPFRYIKGQYQNPSKCEIGEDNNFGARLEMFYYVEDEKVDLVAMIANLVNDHWKVRFKTSNQIAGKGSLVTPVSIK